MPLFVFDALTLFALLLSVDLHQRCSQYSTDHPLRVGAAVALVISVLFTLCALGTTAKFVLGL